VKITQNQIKNLILKEIKALDEETNLTRATPAEAVTVGDVATPDQIAEQIQNIYTEIAQLKTAVANLQGKLS